MVREDTQPWYRQFWPWFIIALPAASVVAGLTTVWISLQTRDSLVIRADDGIQIVAERRLGAEQLAAELNLAFRIDINLDSGALLAAMTSGDMDKLPSGLGLEFSHPAFAERDQRIRLSRAPAGADGMPVWSGHFVSVPDGRWYVTLNSDDGWRLSGEWQGESHIMLRPAETADVDER
jgi:hypothetical protein